MLQFLVPTTLDIGRQKRHVEHENRMLKCIWYFFQHRDDGQNQYIHLPCCGIFTAPCCDYVFQVFLDCPCPNRIFFQLLGSTEPPAATQLVEVPSRWKSGGTERRNQRKAQRLVIPKYPQITRTNLKFSQFGYEPLQNIQRIVGFCSVSSIHAVAAIVECRFTFCLLLPPSWQYNESYTTLRCEVLLVCRWKTQKDSQHFCSWPQIWSWNWIGSRNGSPRITQDITKWYVI